MKELIASVVLVVFLVLVADPFDVWMPMPVHFMVLGIALAAFAAVAAFVLREGTGDERDSTHRMQAGRAAFLVGSGALVLAITVQSFSHSVDPWLAVALVAMLVTKFAVRLFEDRYR